MTLTYGNVPFGPQPAGRFNFTRKGPDAVLYWETFPKRVRVELGGATISDSRRVKALHETGKFMIFYSPRDDVAIERLQQTGHRTECPHKGVASYWTVAADGRTAENGAWSYERPVDSAAWLAGHIAFDYQKMDAWYQEDDKVYAHPRDPYHRFDIHNASRKVIVRHGGAVIADSDRPRVLFETGTAPRFYLPPADVRTDSLERSATVSQCPYKGDGQHWHLKSGGEMIEDVAWSLPRPIGEAESIANYFCFYPEKVHVEVDGERLIA